MTMISGPVAHGSIARKPIFPRLSDFARRLVDERRERTELKVRRQLFRNLLDLDDKTLADIGFTRYEVEDAARLPLEVNASLALRETARKRREVELRRAEERRKGMRLG